MMFQLSGTYLIDANMYMHTRSSGFSAACVLFIMSSICVSHTTMQCACYSASPLFCAGPVDTRGHRQLPPARETPRPPAPPAEAATREPARHEEATAAAADTGAVYWKLHQESSAATVAAWFAELKQAPARPTAEQLRILHAVRACCEVEAEEVRQDLINQAAAAHEPLRALVHGMPGTGKSQVIKRLRDFWENALGWRHAEQFVFLASMDTMAALIGGRSIHSWGHVLVSGEGGRAHERDIARPTPDISKKWAQCQHLR